RQLVTGTLLDDDPQKTSRHLSELAEAVTDLDGTRSRRSSVTFDLKVGANVVNHGLGARPRGCSVSPTVADAPFAGALTPADGRQATVLVLNVAQPGAGIEFWR